VRLSDEISKDLRAPFASDDLVGHVCVSAFSAGELKKANRKIDRAGDEVALANLVSGFLGEEAQDFAHHSIRLVGLKKKLRVGGAIEDYQLLRFRGFFELRANAWKAWSVIVGVVSRDNIEAG